MKAITPKQIEAARQKAVALCHAAYAPQPVQQPDGSTVALCWQGRIQRAVVLANEAASREDRATLQKIEDALSLLERRAKEVTDAAEQAASDYASLCIAIRQEPDDVYPPACTCEGCRIAQASDAYWEAIVQMRKAFFQLFLPNELDGEVLPPVVDLVEAVGDEAKRKELWRLICAIARAQKQYQAACAILHTEPQWKEMLSWR